MSISQEGKLVSRTYAELRKFGFLVYNFNTRRKMQESMAKLCDQLIVGATGIHFIEIKLESTRDRMKPNQLLFKKLIEMVASKTVWVKYWMISSLEEANVNFEFILNGTPDQKGDKLGV